MEKESIVWPKEINPDSFPIHAYNSILLNKSSKEIWEKLINAQNWPSWYRNSKDVQILASTQAKQLLGAGSQFIWQTFGLKVRSVVIQYKPYESLGWTASEFLGWHGYHGWKILEQGDKTLVITEEVQKGPGSFLFKKYIKSQLEKRHQEWLVSLAD